MKIYKQMKQRLFFLVLLLICISMQAQENNTKPHLLFPEFVQGTVLMKDGTRNRALLNYNKASGEMLFVQNKHILAFSEETISQTDTIYIKDKKLICLKDKIVEILHHSAYTLCIEHTCDVEPLGKPAGYGGTSQTTAVENYSAFASGGKLYKLELPNNFKIIPHTVYWMRKGNKLKKFKSIKHVQKFYKKKKEVYKEYIKQHNVDFEDQQAVMRLIDFLESNTCTR